MSSPSVPAVRLPLRPSPLLRRAPIAGSLAPSPALVLKPLVSKAPASYRSALPLHRRRYALPAVAATATSKPLLKVCSYCLSSSDNGGKLNCLMLGLAWIGAQDPKKFQEWDSMTAKFAGAANVPFLLLQLPQIILNSRNLLAGNKTALFAVPWLVCSTHHLRFHRLSFLCSYSWICGEH